MDKIVKEMELSNEEMTKKLVEWLKDAYDQQWKTVENKLKEFGVELDYDNVEDLKEDLKEQGIEVRRVFKQVGDPENCVMLFVNDDYIGRVFDPVMSMKDKELGADVRYEWINDKGTI